MVWIKLIHIQYLALLDEMFIISNIQVANQIASRQKSDWQWETLFQQR